MRLHLDRLRLQDQHRDLYLLRRHLDLHFLRQPLRLQEVVVEKEEAVSIKI